METKKVWYVTGASKGLGLALIKELVKQGYRVAATSRNTGDLEKEVGSDPNFLALEVDLANESSVQKSIAKTLKKFGTINVVVNNAGYGQLGTLEEISDQEARENYDVNVFGTLNVIRSVMAHFRENKNRTHYQHLFYRRLSRRFPRMGRIQLNKVRGSGTHRSACC